MIKPFFRIFTRFAQLFLRLVGSLAVIEIDSCVNLQLNNTVLYQGLVKVTPAQESVSTSGCHIQKAFLLREDGNIEGAATIVKDKDVLFIFLLLLILHVRNGS